MAVLLALVLATSARGAAAAGYPEPVQLERMRTVGRFLLNDRFNAADSVALVMRRHDGRDPAGCLCAAQVLWAKMEDREEEIRPVRFEYLLDTVQHEVARVLDTCDSRTAAWMHLLRGMARFLHDEWGARFGGTGGTITIGLAGAEDFLRGLQADNTVADLYYGQGCHDFWKSTEAGLLGRAGIVEDNRDRGLMELGHAARRGVVYRDFARLALAEAWLEYGQPDSSLDLVRALRERYPEGRRILWLLARVDEARGDLATAAEVYTDLRARILRRPGNYRALVRCDHTLCRLYERSHLPGRAVEQARLVVEYLGKIPPETKRAYRDEIAFLKRVARRR